MPKKSTSREKCECGRLKSKAVRVEYQSGTHLYIFYRCTCSREWTVEEPAVDRSSQVSSEEVLDVHEILKQDLPIQELIDPE